MSCNSVSMTRMIIHADHVYTTNGCVWCRSLYLFLFTNVQTQRQNMELSHSPFFYIRHQQLQGALDWSRRYTVLVILFFPTGSLPNVVPHRWFCGWKRHDDNISSIRHRSHIFHSTQKNEWFKTNNRRTTASSTPTMTPNKPYT